MTAAGLALASWGTYHCLIVATSKRSFRRGMHCVVWGSALAVAGRVR